MRIAVVHLSDIHFRVGTNPVLSCTSEIASAVNSVDATPSLVIIAVSGDIAFSGDPLEYRHALEFFAGLKDQLINLNGGARVEHVCVPGNHDCVLPKEESRLRATLFRVYLLRCRRRSRIRHWAHDPRVAR